MTTAADVADWMLDELKKRKTLYQDQTAGDIEKKFGKSFVYDNQNGGTSIDKKVLKAFNKITSAEVVWERGDRCWRFRTKYDVPGRMQD